MQNRVDSFVRDYEAKQPLSKQVLLLVHKEVQLEPFDGEASFKPQSDWNHQVVENLVAPPQSGRARASAEYIGKSPRNIFEEISFAEHSAVFVKLFRKAAEKLMVDAAQYAAVRSSLLASLEAQSGPRSLFMVLHRLVVKSLTAASSRQWEVEVFRKKELYTTAFDVENLLLNVFSNEYVFVLSKFLRALLRHSALHFFAFFQSPAAEALRPLTQRVFAKELDSLGHCRGAGLPAESLAFRLPFVRPRLERFAQKVRESGAQRLFREKARLLGEAPRDKGARERVAARLGELQAALGKTVAGLAHSLEKSRLWRDVRKERRVPVFGRYMETLLRDALLFYSRHRSSLQGLCGPRAEEEAECRFLEVVREAVLGDLRGREQVPQHFSARLAHVFLMGECFELEMNVCANLVQAAAADQTCFAALKRALVTGFAKEGRRSLFSEVEMALTVAETLLGFFFRLVKGLFHRKEGPQVQDLLANLQRLLELLACQSRLPLAKKRKSKLISKLEVGARLLEFLVFCFENALPLWDFFSGLSFEGSLSKLLLALDRLFAQTELGQAAGCPQFQNLNRVCHAKLSVYFYQTRRPRLGTQDFAALSLRFWRRARHNGYFFRSLVANERRFKMRSGKLELQLAFRNQDKLERRQFLAQLTTAFVRAFRELSPEKRAEHFLRAKDFKADREVG